MAVPWPRGAGDGKCASMRSLCSWTHWDALAEVALQNLRSALRLTALCLDPSNFPSPLFPRAYAPAAPYLPAAPSASSTPRPSVPPVLPPKPNNPFLARRGSQSQSLKKTEQQLEKERMLEVLKSSNPSARPRIRSTSLFGSEGDSASSRSGSSGVAHAKIAAFRRPTLPQDIQPPRLASRSTSSVRAFPHTLADLPSKPPPTHPDRKPPPAPESERPGSPSSRILRSQSMHHASAPPLPPPPRRKRPESVQLAPMAPPSDSSFASPAPHELRRTAHSRGTFPSLANIQKTLTSLQLRPQPHFGAARYKAEARLTRRGFVQHSQHGTRWIREEREEGLMGGVDAGGGGLDQGPDVGARAAAQRARRRRRDG
ncbi:hypothetical protein A0H81_13817 [Grifola frondosa]|uniref:Uncharacterized protein n=1 Tax=Grifola frondosa TaxID=5627 RepID=A0A1C7LNG1_GRIFR|nr:hypothetical protein A0H81_13817 [Grifola frondosa]